MIRNNKNKNSYLFENIYNTNVISRQQIYKDLKKLAIKTNILNQKKLLLIRLDIHLLLTC